ncbi:pantoate--beta-alanine ligase (AMP-forming) [Malassezia cuniculi]|uniref:Pantoate--beta-alanine ligase n=1 Tax=Malassezia cuniculi TaxID=948313 RepID=A0AAF0EZN7_9BASI|nr:pantoate--beta-alanine ligase (AMP-forming) [Malassezia cuniculi]
MAPRTITSAAEYRAWRAALFRSGQSVGFVPTMGALHEGHLSLVDAAQRENDCTVVSIFVNPAQFAPTEDLDSYPRTLESDLAALEKRTIAGAGELVVFVPQVRDMYPNGITQDVAKQVGAFVEVKGLSHQMEGVTRPNFFRGVATVVTKLFNVVLPDRAYFGQKDIQQALILRRLADDLLFSYPAGRRAVRVLPTGRDPVDGLALSSRNAYLDAAGRAVAPALIRALEAGRDEWERLLREGAAPAERVQATLDAARGSLNAAADAAAQASADGARIELDYISLNDPDTFELLDGDAGARAGTGAILSGAMWVYNRAGERAAARLIDNLLLGFALD